MTRVLVVLEGSGAFTQDRVRGPIYAEQFRELGVDVRYVGRQPAAPRRLANSQNRLMREVAKSLEYKFAWLVVDRLVTRYNDAAIVRMAPRFDVIHLIKGVSVRLIRRIRQASRARVVYDLGDAVWHPRYVDHCKSINEILSLCDAVTCDNQYGLDYARQFNQNLFVWPPASQVEAFDLRRDRTRKSESTDGRLTIGWVGSRTTAFNLFRIWEPLEAVFKRFPLLHLRILGAGGDPDMMPAFENVRPSYLPSYNAEQMIAETLRMDIGLFPLFAVHDSEVRGVLKALIYMSGEASLICSRVGALQCLIRDGENGLLAGSDDEWIGKLTQLVADPTLRRRCAAGGLATVRDQFSLSRSFEFLRRALGI